MGAIEEKAGLLPSPRTHNDRQLSSHREERNNVIMCWGERRYLSKKEYGLFSLAKGSAGATTVTKEKKKGGGEVGLRSVSLSPPKRGGKAAGPELISLPSPLSREERGGGGNT